MAHDHAHDLSGGLGIVALTFQERCDECSVRVAVAGSLPASQVMTKGAGQYDPQITTFLRGDFLSNGGDTQRVRQVVSRVVAFVERGYGAEQLLERWVSPELLHDTHRARVPRGSAIGSSREMLGQGQEPGCHRPRPNLNRNRFARRTPAC